MFQNYNIKCSIVWSSYKIIFCLSVAKISAVILSYDSNYSELFCTCISIIIILFLSSMFISDTAASHNIYCLCFWCFLLALSIICFLLVLHYFSSVFYIVSTFFGLFSFRFVFTIFAFLWPASLKFSVQVFLSFQFASLLISVFSFSYFIPPLHAICFCLIFVFAYSAFSLFSTFFSSYVVCLLCLLISFFAYFLFYLWT